MAIAVERINVIHGGLQDYEASWAIQRDIHQRVAEGDSDHTLILIEHPSVYTAGRRTDILERPQDGTPVIEVDRGGRITWHGPGQIVGYPIVRLEKRNEVVGFVRTLEDALIKTLADFSISGIQVDGKTYEITRTLSKYTKKLKGEVTDEAKATVDFVCITPETGEKVSLNGIDGNETNKNIRRVFGSLEDFFATSMSSQTGALDFINEGSKIGRAHV